MESVMQNNWTKHRKYLESERAVLYAELQGLGRVQVGDRGSHGSFTQSEEAAMAFSEMEKSAAHRNSLARRLQEVEAALERLERGAYGVCESCGQSIPRERLDAVPQTTHCVKCTPGAGKPASAMTR